MSMSESVFQTADLLPENNTTSLCSKKNGFAHDTQPEILDLRSSLSYTDTSNQTAAGDGGGHTDEPSLSGEPVELEQVCVGTKQSGASENKREQPNRCQLNCSRQARKTPLKESTNNSANSESSAQCNERAAVSEDSTIVSGAIALFALSKSGQQ